MKKILIVILVLIGLNINAQEKSYVCEGSSVTFVATCTGGSGISIIWTNPNNVETLGNTVTADIEGVYTWECEDEANCTASGWHELIVVPNPIGGIVINAEDACTGVPQLIDATGVPAGYTYEWDFDSGAVPPTSTSSSTSVYWETTGVKTIELTITGTFNDLMTTNGCEAICEWVITKQITIGELSGSSNCTQ